MNNRLRQPTSTQPQINDSRIYSSKAVPTIHVKPVGGDRELTIDETDFDPERFVRVESLFLARK